MTPNPNFSVVPLEECHLDAVASLEAACFSRPWSRAALAAELTNPTACFYVALAPNGTVAGYTGMHCVCGECYMANLCAHPAWRRQGVGTLLLRALLQKAVGIGASFLTLEVRASNRAAQSLYEKHGFTPIGTRRAFYDLPREDAVLYIKRFEPERSFRANENSGN